ARVLSRDGAMMREGGGREFQCHVRFLSLRGWMAGLPADTGPQPARGIVTLPCRMTRGRHSEGDDVVNRRQLPCESTRPAQPRPTREDSTSSFDPGVRGGPLPSLAESAE